MHVQLSNAQALAGFIALTEALDAVIETASRLDDGTYAVMLSGSRAARDELSTSLEAAAYVGERAAEIAETVRDRGPVTFPVSGRADALFRAVRATLCAVARSARWTAHRAAHVGTSFSKRMGRAPEASTPDRASLVSAGVPERTANALFTMSKGLPALPRHLRRDPDPCRAREWVHEVVTVASEEGPGPESHLIGIDRLPTWAIAHFAFEANVTDGERLARLFGLKVPERNWLVSVMADAESAGAAHLRGARLAQLIVLVEHDHRATTTWGRLRKWVRVSQVVGGPAAAGGVGVLLVAGQVLPGLTLLVAAATLLSQVEYRVTIVTREARLFRRAAIERLRSRKSRT